MPNHSRAARRPLTVCTVITISLLVALALAAAARADEAERSVAELIAHLEAVVPQLLDESGVPGTALALVHEGRTVYLSGLGWADRSAGDRVGPDTLFNVGSISKTLTAWGVLSLVEDGALTLDDPVGPSVEPWPLADGSSPRGLTLRNLLDHTGGLTAPSVPEYLPWEPVESLRSWLGRADQVRLETEPGAEWSYSGAGYSLLQLAVETVSGMPFEAHMRSAVLEPLGMKASTFVHPATTAGLARPYAEGDPIPFRRYTGLAAAGLYTSARDLAAFMEAHASSGGRPPGRGVVSKALLDDMGRPNPVSLSPYGTSYGLGYSVWPLAGGDTTRGHGGQNHGWSAVFWLSSNGEEGLAVLTNDSKGENVHRWIVCDWARWLAGRRSFGGFCSERDEHPLGPLFAEPPPDSSQLQAIVRRHLPQGGPGLAASITTPDRVLLREAFGLADVESGIGLSPATPFYLASLAKPITSSVILDLIAQGSLALDDRLDALLPGLTASAGAATVRHLLMHTSGVPDFWAFLDWRRLPPLDNAAVLRLVSEAAGPPPEPATGPGTTFDYSNTGYLALASIAERVTGRPFASLLRERWPCAASTSALFVLDRPDEDLPQRARGYGMQGDELRLLDYRRLELQRLPPLEPRFSMVGAGGVVSNVDGVSCWARSLLDRGLLPAGLDRLALETGVDVSGLEGLGEGTRACLALLESSVEGTRVLWYDGALFGHRSLLVVEPARELVLVLLSNSADADLKALGRELLSRILG
jgi:CubicO group peptidase (beta-lactamase class C family)